MSAVMPCIHKHGFTSCKSAALALIVLFTLVACGGSETCIAVRSFDDTSGDAAFAFIDLTSASVEDCGSHLIVRMNLLDVPQAMVFDSVNIKSHHVEYAWDVTFATSLHEGLNDGLIFTVYNIKEAGESPRTTAMLASTRLSLMTMTSIVPAMTLDERHEVGRHAVDGNTLVINIDKSEHELLAHINASTAVRFDTRFSSDTTTYYDHLPDRPSDFLQ